VQEFQNTFGSRANFFSCDVTKMEEFSTSFKLALNTMGSLDIMVNSAGISTGYSDLKDQQILQQWMKCIDVCLNGVIYGTQLAVAHFQTEKKHGVIINIASMAGILPTEDPAYSAAKAGVIMFSRSLEHLKHEGIRVNALCPSFTDTPMVAPRLKKDPRNLRWQSEVIKVGGLLAPEYVVEGMMILATNDSLAGETLRVTQKNGIDFHRWDRTRPVPKVNNPLGKPVLRSSL